MTGENRLKTTLEEGGRVLGTWSMLGAPSVINVIGHSNMDFVIIDMEHGPVSFETVENQLFAAEVTGCTPIVRLGDSSEAHLLHALEIGVQSVLVSHVSSAEDALRIVRACRYHPEGNRGLSPFTRNHGFSDEELASKLQRANDQVFVGVLVEGSNGLDNLHDICSVPGLDMVYLGIYDVSQSLGVPGDLDHPSVVEVVHDCVKTIQSKGLIAGSVAKNRDYLDLMLKAGFRFISYRVDSAIMREGYLTVRGWYDELTEAEV